ncbi:MAG TPA: phage holin family protein [Terriglobales bacterium]|nr:phage holin family protein [Terriglobales bacterium]
MERLRNTPAEPTLAQVVTEITLETKAFLHTRLEMLRAELRQNIRAWKIALPVAASALLLLGSAYLLFLAALVDAVYVVLPPVDFRWALAFAIVGFVWSIPGLVMAYFAIQKLRRPPLVPRRTLEVLKADKHWLESEIKAA